MNSDVFLKVIGYGPLKAGTAELDGGFLRIPRFTAVIGDNGTGKSVLSKLYCAFSSLEIGYVLNPQSISEDFSSFLGYLCSCFNLSKQYSSRGMNLEYRGQYYSICVKYGSVSVNRTENQEWYRRRKYIYYPEERNLVLETPKEISRIIQLLVWDYKDASKSYADGAAKLSGDYRFRYSKKERKGFIIDNNGLEIPCDEASSGFRFLIPLLVTSDYYGKYFRQDELTLLKKSYDTVRYRVLSEVTSPQLQGYLKEFFSSRYKMSFSEFEKKKIAEPIHKYVESSLVQIVEEPELGLHPVNQVEVLKRLIASTPENGKLFITTYSPYILSAVENYNCAYDRYISSHKIIPEIPKELMLPFEDTAAYIIENGCIKSIMDDESRMVNGSRIDGCSAFLNSEFDRLMAD